MRFADMLAQHPWRPIRGCPGRFSLAPNARTPYELTGLPGQEHSGGPSRDPFVVTPLEDGGLISYQHADGLYLHTLGDSDGWGRKLRMLGLER